MGIGAKVFNLIIVWIVFQLHFMWERESFGFWVDDEDDFICERYRILIEATLSLRSEELESFSALVETS